MITFNRLTKIYACIDPVSVGSLQTNIFVKRLKLIMPPSLKNQSNTPLGENESPSHDPREPQSLDRDFLKGLRWKIQL
ncbi:MAG: hypothetical protein ACXVCD_19830 [Pseudobdellovibrionaceae bacterium]